MMNPNCKHYFTTKNWSREIAAWKFNIGNYNDSSTVVSNDDMFVVKATPITVYNDTNQ